MNPGPELDALVAERVMGWERWWVTSNGWRWRDAGKLLAWEKDWRPSADIAAAWKVVERMIGLDYVVVLTGLVDWNCRFEEDFDIADYPRRGPMFGEADEATAPMAICIAALQAAAAAGGKSNG